MLFHRAATLCGTLEYRRSSLMLDEPLRILIAAAICWINFMTVDLIFKLPHSGGVSGATAIAREVEKGGGKLNGGFMMGNIVSSPRPVCRAACLYREPHLLRPRLCRDNRGYHCHTHRVRGCPVRMVNRDPDYPGNLFCVCQQAH